MRFREKTAIVTAGSDGIGYAVAETLATEGATLVLVARRSDVLRREASKLGPRVGYVVGDVAEEETALWAVSRAVDISGGLDLLVCNARVLIPGPVAVQPLEQLDRVLSVNLRGRGLFRAPRGPGNDRVAQCSHSDRLFSDRQGTGANPGCLRSFESGVELPGDHVGDGARGAGNPSQRGQRRWDLHSATRCHMRRNARLG